MTSNIGVELSEVHAETINIRDVTVGSTAEQVRTLIEAATTGADEKVAEAGRQLGVTQGAMRTMLATVGETNIPDERLVEKLAEVFEQTRKAGAAIAALRSDNPVAQAHVTDALEAQACGDREQARQHLRAAREAAEAAAQEARRLARHAEAAAGKQMLQAARAAAAEAELALAGLDYEEAGRLFGEAVALVPADETDEKSALIRGQADALLRQGDEYGDNAALRQAIGAYGRALELSPRDRAPIDWARTQSNLGFALSRLGERESGTARLEDAVIAFRDALKELTRQRAPLDWAQTQNKLGYALWALGERYDSGTAFLEEAVDACREALKESTREVMPLDWAGAQNTLGNAFLALAEHESDPARHAARLDDAINAYCKALEERTRERAPLDWATTQNNLGYALLALEQRESGTAHLEQAVMACRNALQERTRERVRLRWAKTQNNLANALLALGEREGGTARLEEAVAAYGAALEIFNVAGATHYASVCSKNIARARSVLNGEGQDVPSQDRRRRRPS